MKTFLLFFLTTLFCWAGDEGEQRLLGKSDEVSLKGKVVVIEIGQDDLINKQAFRFWRRTLQRAVDEEAAAVVLELNTPGGLAFDTRDIIMDELGKLEIPLIAWVKREALSAGALIAFSADRIYMASGTTIGSAGLIDGSGVEIEPVTRAKLESAFESSMRSIVEKKGHRMDILQAMMFLDDEERQIGPVTVRKNYLLNLTAKEAVQVVDGKPFLAVGIAESLDEVLEKEDLAGAVVIRPKPTAFEMLAWHVAAFSPLLLAVGLGCAYMEIKAPGFGLFGFLSLLVFAVFFFGNNIAGNLAGYELMAVFLIGIILILLEIFVLPGMVAGVLGGMMVVGSLLFAMTDKLDYERSSNDSQMVGLMDVLTGPALYLVGGLVGSIFLMYLAIRYLPELPMFRSLVVKKALATGDSMDEVVEDSPLLGCEAEVVSDLRPSGTILVNGVNRDAISQQGLIAKGERVKIVEDGMRIVVEKV